MQKLVEDFPNKIYFQEVNVCDYDSLKRRFRWIEEKFGGLDVLINCASEECGENIFGNGDMEGILTKIDKNFSGTVRSCRLAYDLMKRKDFGYILNFNLMNDCASNYSMNSNAIKGLTEVLRQELKNLRNDRIRVTVRNCNHN